jgi:hypothetical protein
VSYERPPYATRATFKAFKALPVIHSINYWVQGYLARLR